VEAFQPFELPQPLPAWFKGFDSADGGRGAALVVMLLWGCGGATQRVDCACAVLCHAGSANLSEI